MPDAPEVQEERPGVCPKCGMVLERKSITGIERRTEYTCPMHPEIIQEKPGPLCQDRCRLSLRLFV